MSKDKNNAFGKLLAAEASYLNSRGWLPYVQVGLVSWKDPKEDEHQDRRYRQDVAVGMQREREPEDLRYTGGGVAG